MFGTQIAAQILYLLSSGENYLWCWCGGDNTQTFTPNPYENGDYFDGVAQVMGTCAALNKGSKYNVSTLLSSRCVSPLALHQFSTSAWRRTQLTFFRFAVDSCVNATFVDGTCIRTSDGSNCDYLYR